MSEPSTTRGSAARTGALVFTALSVVFAAGGGWLMWHLLTAGGYDREQMKQVVVAATPVGAGRPLRAEDLRVIPWPASAVPEGAFSDITALLKPQPAVPTAGFVAGEPILKERLASPEAGPGLSALVGKESRAVAVQVDRGMAAARLLYPGAHVDVLVTLEDRPHNAVVTRTVLEDVRVLAVGSFADVDAARRGNTDPNKQSGEADAVVTLEVVPADAERLALSARQGKLDLALRNATDRSRSPTNGVAMAELVSIGQPIVPEAARAPVAPPAAVSSRHRSASGGGATSSSGGAPSARSFPRQPGGDQPSTIEVYSVPTQAR